jgi:hypothetical protein
MADRPRAIRHAEAPAWERVAAEQRVAAERVVAAVVERAAAADVVDRRSQFRYVLRYVPGSLKIWKWREAICGERR